MSEEEECEIVNTDEEWLKKQKDSLAHIKEFKSKNDRLLATTQLSYMHNALCGSILSWNNCINGWVTMELGNKIKVSPNEDVIIFTDAELKDLHDKYKEFAIKFMELDIAITELFITKALLKKKTSKKTKIKNEHKMVV